MFCSDWDFHLNWKKKKVSKPSGVYVHFAMILNDFYLKWLKGEGDIKALCYNDPPDTHLVGQVVIRIIGRLDLAAVPLHFSSTHGCTRWEKWHSCFFSSFTHLCFRSTAWKSFKPKVKICTKTTFKMWKAVLFCAYFVHKVVFFCFFWKAVKENTFINVLH